MPAGAAKADMKRATWLDLFGASGPRQPLSPKAREALSRLDDALFDLWNLGENVLLAWTHEGRELRFLSVRHYVLAKAIQPAGPGTPSDAVSFVNEVLAG